MRVFVVTPPEPVVSLDEAKAHLRVRHGAEDDLIKAYVAAATGHIDGPEGWLGRAIGMQTLEVREDVFRDCMRLPFPPIVDIVSVKHLDAAAAEVTILPSEYEVRGLLIGSAFGKRWPSVLAQPESVRIQYRAGYDTLPPAIRAAILLMTGDLYANRETTAAGTSTASIPMSTTVENLLQPFRVFA
ncbi:head-tail connector protein [Novosphingobium sp. AP12]|uniref:head-tail connector protein n=1 Tax=Novosphingobium sp. AP12 TaxID=1144305 RepID=UPI000271DE01|nr:head-tail connector protein [Novosphingobium sp. AP12]EJL21899.1 phage conserved hypothetical protein, gp8 family [Novosphingobium sp. AP12]